MIVEILLISNKVVPEGLLPAELREIDRLSLGCLETPTYRFQAIKMILVGLEC